MTDISSHASIRIQQRGLPVAAIDEILENADIDRPIGDNCRLLRVSKPASESLGSDRLHRYGVIWSDDSLSVVTVLPVIKGRRGRRYRRQA